MALQRQPVPKPVETFVLVASRRRCCVCYFLKGIKTAQKGQIAHLNHDRRDNRRGNLVYLCLDHHDDFDGSTRLSKRLSVSEVRHYRNQLYRALGTSRMRLPAARASAAAIRKARAAVPDQRPKSLAFLDQPWRLTWLEDGRPELFAFKAVNRCDGICRVERRDLRDGRVLIICEQIDENPGLSVTNNIEYLALQLCEHFQVTPSKLVLLEHYRTSYANEHEWNLVEFRERSLKRGFSDPSWRPMSDDDWRLLGFRPRRRLVLGTNRRSLLVPLYGGPRGRPTRQSN